MRHLSRILRGLVIMAVIGVVYLGIWALWAFAESIGGERAPMALTVVFLFVMLAWVLGAIADGVFDD